MGNLWAWFKKNKLYFFHGAGMLVLFLDSSVNHLLSQHPNYTVAGITVWGYILHWAEGQGKPSKDTIQKLQE